MTGALAGSIQILESEYLMALLNNTCTYAIRAALHVAAARPGPGTFVSTRKIADDLGVPFAFLTKVLQGLTQSGILLSQRGAAGGISLARPAREVTLMDILASVGGNGVFRDCVLGLPQCSDLTPCALHHSWREERARLEGLFLNTTLADLADGNGVPEILEPTAGAEPADARRKTARRAP